MIENFESTILATGEPVTEENLSKRLGKQVTFISFKGSIGGKDYNGHLEFKTRELPSVDEINEIGHNYLKSLHTIETPLERLWVTLCNRWRSICQ